MSDAPAIEVRDVVKEYDGGQTRALDGASLRVEPGEWVALTGPSGCGKSTLLHLLAALDRPTSGSIVVNGRDVAADGSLDDYRRKQVGLVFQLHNLLPHLSAAENIAVAMLGAAGRPRDHRKRALELLESVGLGTKGRLKPPKLSGGERQRVAIARSLANEPAVLLADEPTGSLDSAATALVLELFGRLREERHVTVLMVTHDMQVAATADRTVFMRDGRVLAANPRGETTQPATA